MKYEQSERTLILSLGSVILKPGDLYLLGNKGLVGTGMYLGIDEDNSYSFLIEDEVLKVSHWALLAIGVQST